MQEAKLLKRLQSGEKMDFASLIKDMNNLPMPKSQLDMVQMMTKMIPKELQKLDVSPLVPKIFEHLEGKNISSTGEALASLTPLVPKAIDSCTKKDDASLESAIQAFADEVVRESKLESKTSQDEPEPIEPKNTKEEEEENEVEGACNEFVSKWKMPILFASGVIVGIASQFIL